MPKKIKLDLSGLKVQSFVTSVEKNEQEEVKGGALPKTCGTCDFCSWTYFWQCGPSDTFSPYCASACDCSRATYCNC